jgi:AraC-like DNA-binding protein
MQITAQDYLFILVISSSFIASLIFGLYQWRKGIVQKMITLLLFVVFYGLFLFFLNISGLIENYPHLLRTGFVSLSLTPPFLYLILTVMYLDKRLKTLDLLHFSLTFIYILNYLPLYSLSGEEKLLIIQNMSWPAFNEGWFFPNYFLLIANAIQMLVYFVLSFTKVILPMAYDQSLTREQKSVYFSLIFFNSILLIFPFFGMIWEMQLFEKDVYPILLILILISQLIFFITVLLNPSSLLHRQQFKKPNHFSSPEDTSGSIPSALYPLEIIGDLNPRETTLVHKVNDCLVREKVFLDNRLSLEKFAEKVLLSPFQLRKLLKNAYDLSFPDYINYHRISYLVASLENNEMLRNYTVHSLALYAGFSNSYNFTLAFKKFLNNTPREFIIQMEAQQLVSKREKPIMVHQGIHFSS